ncbi:MAG: transposase [Nitrospiraceae bacterium]|nr:transposase [Nitrospiraceae bacterium]
MSSPLPLSPDHGVHAHRGGIALSEFDLLPRFRGRLIHDCWAPYFAYDIPQGLCNAPLCRELVFVEEVLGQAWARPLRLFLEDALSAASIHRECQTAFSPEELSLLSARYDELIAQGWAENPLPDPGPKRRGRPKRSKAQNLLFRMEHHKESILAFTVDLRVPFTNNLAERDLRMLKVKQKISGCFRTFPGAKRFAKVRSYISPAVKNGQNILGALTGAFLGTPFIPSRAP